MSQHEIEGLIEDSVHLVAGLDMPMQARREMFHALYSVQGRHDCGYTHFRCEDILRENQFLFSRPISAHPDYGTSNFQDQLMAFKDVESAWLTSPSGKVETVFARNEASAGGDIYFHFDYGTSLWQILVEDDFNVGAPLPFFVSESEVTATLMKIALEAGDETLALNWYSYFTNTLIQDGVQFADGKEWDILSFFDRLTHAKLKEIREQVERCDLNVYTEDWGYLKAPIWREEKDIYDTAPINEHFTVRYLLDLKSSADKILTDYEKAKVNANKFKKIIKIVPEYLNTEFFDAKGWAFTGEQVVAGDKAWVWYKDITGSAQSVEDDFLRGLVIIRHNIDDGGLSCNLGIQNGRLLRWQNRMPRTHPVYLHIHDSILHLMAMKDIEANKALNAFGLWKIKASSSEAAIKKSLGNLIEVLDTYAPKYFGKIAQFFNPKTARIGDEDFITAFKRHRKKLKTKRDMPRFLYAPYHAFLYAGFAADAGETESVKTLLKTARKKTKKSHHASPLRTIVLPVIDAIKSGHPFHFPLVFHGYFHNDSSTPLI